MGRVYFNTRKSRMTINDAYTVKASESGRVFMLNNATGSNTVVTLPTLGGTGDDLAQEGIYYKFIVEEDTPGNQIMISAGSAIVDMAMKDSAGDASNSTIDTAISNIIVGTAAKQGDYINMFHDGVSWYAECMSSTDNSITTS